MNKEYISISDINRIIKFTIDNNESLRSVYIKGEISNIKFHSRGHLYFSLKDENSKINAVMFNYNRYLNFTPKDGDSVLVHGKVSVYEATGSYQIYVDEMNEDGLGNLYQLFEELKKKLSSEGLFSPEHKKKINRLPRKIGVITAPTGAAIRDIISTINKRYPLVEIYVFPTLVQGDNAGKNIVRMIELANTYPLDTIILGRGGGSIEDLWAFNEEIVAEAIFNSKIPIISAVGHEIDFTISDFVADLRAPTPTAAAELAVPSTIELISYINQLNIRRNKGIVNIINKNKEKLLSLTSSYILKNPESIYEVKAQKIDNLVEKLLFIIKSKLDNNYNNLKHIEVRFNNNIKNTLNNKTNRYINILNKLEALNPILTIKRGYTITSINDKSFNSINSVKKDDIIKTKVMDGYIKSKVIEIGEE